MDGAGERGCGQAREEDGSTINGEEQIVVVGESQQALTIQG